MKRLFVFSTLTLALVAPAAAVQPSGMAAMQYYVGTWACLAGEPNHPPSHATVTYTLDLGVLRQWGVVPAQGKTKRAYAFGDATTYDAKKDRYVSAFADNLGGWELSVASPWNGQTEQWTDRSTDTGELGRVQVVRTDTNDFVVVAYETKTASQPNFRVTCKRSA